MLPNENNTLRSIGKLDEKPQCQPPYFPEVVFRVYLITSVHSTAIEVKKIPITESGHLICMLHKVFIVVKRYTGIGSLKKHRH